MSGFGGEDPPGAGRPPGLDEVVELVRAVVAANVAGAVELVGRINEVVRRVVADLPAPAPGPGDLVARLLDGGPSAYAEVAAHGLALLEVLVSLAERALVPEPAGAKADTAADDRDRVRSALSGLGIGDPEAERLLSDPLAFVSDHRAEARLVAGWLRGLAAAAAARGGDGAAPTPPTPPSRRRPSRAAEELRRSPSLLR